MTATAFSPTDCETHIYAICPTNVSTITTSIDAAFDPAIVTAEYDAKQSTQLAAFESTQRAT